MFQAEKLLEYSNSGIITGFALCGATYLTSWLNPISNNKGHYDEPGNICRNGIGFTSISNSHQHYGFKK